MTDQEAEIRIKEVETLINTYTRLKDIPKDVTREYILPVLQARTQYLYIEGREKKHDRT